MAGFRETVSVVVDVVTGNAKSEFGKLSDSVKSADGAFGKAKAGLSQLGTALTESPAALAAAGGAVVAFATKAVFAFQNTALAAGKLAEATGLTTAEAGQMLEVFGDVGISGESLGSALNKMNKAVDTNRDAFEKLGLVGGTTRQTFLNVINYLNSISDPAKRAAEGTRLLGKNWADMAEIVAAGGKNLTDAMDQVSTHKAITPEQVAQARALRDNLDRLQDTMDELQLTLGSTLLPTFTRWAADLGKVTNGLNTLTDSVGGLSTIVDYGTSNIVDLVDGIGKLIQGAPSAA